VVKPSKRTTTWNLANPIKYIHARSKNSQQPMASSSLKFRFEIEIAMTTARAHVREVAAPHRRARKTGQKRVLVAWISSGYAWCQIGRGSTSRRVANEPRADAATAQEIGQEASEMDACRIGANRRNRGGCSCTTCDAYQPTLLLSRWQTFPSMWILGKE
jgi:hypothetical protein